MSLSTRSARGAAAGVDEPERSTIPPTEEPAAPGTFASGGFVEELGSGEVKGVIIEGYVFDLED